MLSSILLLVPFLAGINAVNDWKVPCTQGSCSYDLPTTDNSTSAGTLRIWGSSDAITDITTAAGWQILGCDSNALNQSIRLVCTEDPEDPASNCGHLYQNIGAVNKLVRLPQDCGASAFARISDAWVSADQSIPASVQKRIVRRDGTPPVVKALALDVNFDAVDYSLTGPVNIEIEGGNAPVEAAPASRRMERRNLVNVAGKTGTFKLKPLALKKNVNLINKAVSCGPAGGSLKVDMSANANAQATITVTAKGTVVPPNVRSPRQGHMDSGKINLLTAAVPGLSFPGILTVGPTFKVDTQFVGDVQVPMAMTVGMNFAVNNAQLSFPPSASNKPSPSAFSVGDMPLTLNAQSNVKAKGTMTATLVPSINLGVNALGGKAVAQIFLSFNTNAALTMNLDGNAAHTLAARAITGSAGLSGCVKVSTGISVNAGASGSFFSVFNQSTKSTLFSKNFSVFSKCFGVKTRSMRSMPRVSRLDRVRRAGALSCPVGTTKPVLSPITSGTVSKSRSEICFLRRPRS
ncbi:hypothetical protein C8F04DRAFT_952076 [Mycena alexandri]|uniref:DUF7223 domain-containing protein n=1 Tax=Mycena alexandri TaxID=1745969 RepID=A0AAD6T2B4_9AGAR|nr:hypothetical protein C8F04DRAFT_952076 [Mycena alexandri]